MAGKPRNVKTPELIESRVEKIPFAGCWIWTGATATEYGYGQLCLYGKPRYAHRVSYEIFRGPIPPRMHVLHRCDVALCVNPAHLFVGTHADNMRDMTAKGRDRRRGNAKLTYEQVAEIRQSTMTNTGLASRYSVSRRCIREVKLGRSYR